MQVRYRYRRERIVISGGAFYVANTDNASIVKIPSMHDGSPGAGSLLAGPDCAKLAGADGLITNAAFAGNPMMPGLLSLPLK